MLKQTDYLGWQADQPVRMIRSHRYIMARQVGQKDVVNEGIMQIQVQYARDGVAPIAFHLHPKDALCEWQDHDHIMFIEETDIEKVTVIP